MRAKRQTKAERVVEVVGVIMDADGFGPDDDLAEWAFDKIFGSKKPPRSEARLFFIAVGKLLGTLREMVRQDQIDARQAEPKAEAVLRRRVVPWRTEANQPDLFDDRC